MIHWTRQIKEVLNAQESVETGENLGPLEEIEFWRNRCMDLSGISKQLVKDGVKHIESILRLAKSSYLAPFMKLAQQIQVREQAQGQRLSTVGIVVETAVSWVQAEGASGVLHGRGGPQCLDLHLGRVQTWWDAGSQGAHGVGRETPARTEHPP